MTATTTAEIVTVTQREWASVSTREPKLVPSIHRRTLLAKILRARSDAASHRLAKQVLSNPNAPIDVSLSVET